MLTVWELIKWGLISVFGLFYTLIFTIFVVRLVRALWIPFDESQLIDFINNHNEKETLKEWKERDS